MCPPPRVRCHHPDMRTHRSSQPMACPKGLSRGASSGRALRRPGRGVSCRPHRRPRTARPCPSSQQQFFCPEQCVSEGRRAVVLFGGQSWLSLKPSDRKRQSHTRHTPKPLERQQKLSSLPSCLRPFAKPASLASICRPSRASGGKFASGHPTCAHTLTRARCVRPDGRSPR